MRRGIHNRQRSTLPLHHRRRRRRRRGRTRLWNSVHHRLLIVGDVIRTEVCRWVHVRHLPQSTAIYEATDEVPKIVSTRPRVTQKNTQETSCKQSKDQHDHSESPFSNDRATNNRPSDAGTAHRTIAKGRPIDNVRVNLVTRSNETRKKSNENNARLAGARAYVWLLCAGRKAL